MTTTSHSEVSGRRGPDGAAGAVQQRWELAPALLQISSQGGSDIERADGSEWERVLRTVKNLGFDNVDLTDTWLRIGDLDSGRLTELRDILTSIQLRPTSVSVVRRSVVDAQGGEANVDYTLRVLEASAALGVSVVSIGLHQALTPAQQAALWFWAVPGHVDPDDATIRARAAARIHTIAEHAQSLGLQLSLEMYEDTYLGTADSSLRLLEEIDHPAVGLNPDLGNLVRPHRAVEDWEEILVKTLPFTNFWHVKNYFRMEDPARGIVMTSPAPLESGFVNYRRALELARDAGFSGNIVVEHYGGDGLSVSRTGADYLRGLMTEMEALS